MEMKIDKVETEFGVPQITTIKGVTYMQKDF